MEISACPKCGSRRIFQGRLKEGVLIGYTPATYVCRNCGYRGLPVIFDSEGEYKKFLKEFKGIEGYEKEYEKIKDQTEEKKSFFLKNINIKLGLALIVSALVIGAGTKLAYINLIGILILDGIVLFLVGLFGKKDEEQDIEKIKRYPKIAGFIMIITGLFFLFIYLLMIYYFLNIDLLPSEQIEMFNGSESFLTISIIQSLFCLIGIVGGIFSIFKRKWGIAVIGAIVGTLILMPITTILSLAALILINLSKPVFKNDRKNAT